MYELTVILRFHDLVDRLSAEENALDVDRLHLVPVLKRDLVDTCRARDARVVYPDVDASEDILHLVDILLDVIEIGYVEIGKNIKIIEAPGEAMPELIYGGFYSAEESFTGTEYPYEGVATCFGEEDEVLVFGLCNDAVGYIVPDNDYSSSGAEGHYEETVSTGSKSGTAFSEAFFKLLGEWG